MSGTPDIAPDRATSAAAAGAARDFGSFYLSDHFSDVAVVIKEELATAAQVADEVDYPPCKGPRVSAPSAGDHADVRCTLLTVASPHKGLRLLLTARERGRTEEYATRLPGHKMVWGRSGFFRSKVNA